MIRFDQLSSLFKLFIVRQSAHKVTNLINKKKAILIGIEYIGTSSELPGCQTDVKNVFNLLTKNLGYLSGNILILTEDNGLKPTRENILTSIKNLSNNATTNNIDEVLIYYSGHGNQIPDRNNEESDKKDEILVPLDYRTDGIIKDDTIHTYVGIHL